MDADERKKTVQQ